MRIIGVDPGTRHLGWGVIQREGTRVCHVGHGVIHTVPKSPLADRLLHIDEALREVIGEHRPEVGAVESIFFSKNAQSAAKLGHARGVVLLALRRAGLEVHEYPPARIKRAVVGGGRATKGQVARVVASLLGLTPPPPEDAADALATALTHMQVASFEEALRRGR